MKIVPASLKPIADSELTGATQTVRLAFTARICTPDGACATPCNYGEPNCDYHALIDDHVFMPTKPPRTLKLNTASEWIVSNDDGAFGHPFHIHVNPFQYDRLEPDQQGNIVTRRTWKDTLIVPFDGTPIKLRSRYIDYVGTFVLHCHILGHEDMGMMELVRIRE